MKLLDYWWNLIMLKRKKVKYGSNLKLYGRLHIHGGKGNIIIGDDCQIVSNADRNPTVGGIYSHLTAGPNGKLIIGNNVGMSMVSISAYDCIKIEDNVRLGAGTKIWDTDFHPIKYDERINSDKPVVKPILIKEGAFIGACSIVLKGVTIGKHAVIGAGSVVSRNIPDGEIWAGNPVKRLRKIEDI